MNEAPAAPAAPAATGLPAAEGQVLQGETAPPEEPKPERVFKQSELDEIIKKKDAKRLRERDELRRENEVLRKLALERRAESDKAEDRQDKPQAQPQSGEPKRDQFPDYESYIEAKAEWKADQKVEARFKERDTASQKEKQETERNKSAEAFRTRTKELAKDLADFDEVMADATSDPNAPVSRIFVDPVQECDNPAAVLYHLAKNPEEAERIASLSGHKQAREIWALDTKLKSEPPPRKPSKAPEPIKPVGGKEVAAGAEPDPNKDQQGWIDWRNKQELAKRTGR